MDRFAIFIDAGYLYAGAGQLCHGTIQRHKLVLDAPGLCARLVSFAEEDCAFQHLRTYWYDGAKGAQPTVEHIAIANLPGVKLRLGRLTQQGQKGVDSRIVRDLIILAHSRGMSTAYLLGGDEDLREGVAEAQERGVRVVLLSIEESGVSATLRMEADNLVSLDKEFLAPFISLTEVAASAPSIKVEAKEHPVVAGDPHSIGTVFGADWWERTALEVRTAVLRDRPRIPRDLDSALLQTAGSAIEGGDVPQDWRPILRAGFWQAVETLAASGSIRE